uniref:Subtilisin-like protease 3 n=1 Tax=Anthurium amnicola TaxID=1678845 RepID=A0A1D1XLG0_9ARAE
MVASSFIKIFSIVVLAALSISAQRECPSIQAEDNNTEKKRFIVIFDKKVKNAAEDHYEMMKKCYETRVQSVISDEADESVSDQSTIRDFSVDGTMQGYTAYFTPEFAKAVEKMKNVVLVEEEKEVKEDKILRAAPRRFSRRYSINRRVEDDSPPPNIDRIDQTKRPLDGKFIYPDSAGEGVNIFIVDSGIFLTHREFGGRAKFGRSFCKGCEKDFIDEHGTFVASVAAGKTVGVARKANIIDVRVLDEKAQGSTADKIEGLSYVISQHKKSKNKNSVINMSLRVIPLSHALNHAVKEATDAGIHVAVSAGNSGQDACGQSPAAAPSAITVGATEFKSDAIADFSNFGKCVDIFAPGRNITGAGIDNNHDYLKGYFGTSFSSPLVAGTLALLISKNGNKPPSALTKDLIDLSTKGVVIGLKNKKGTPNTFLRTPAS